MSTSNGKVEQELLREGFANLFPAQHIKPFGHRGRRVIGVYDGSDGVQWNTGTMLLAGHWTNYFMGVNLEGLEYNGERPLYRLIQRELENPLIFGARRSLQQPRMTGMSLTRDAWYGPASPRARPLHYLDRFILPGAPRNLDENSWSRVLQVDELNEKEWRQALEKSLDCFDSRGDSVWRVITFYNPGTGQPESKPRPNQYKMTPHLHFRSALNLDKPFTWNDLVKALQNALNLGKTLGETWPEGKDALVEAMLRARQRMQTLYDFVRERSGRSDQS